MTADLAGLTRRPITATDAPALAVLLNAIEVVDVFGEYYSEEDAAEQINAPLLDLERGTTAFFLGDRMVGYSSAAHRPHATGVHRVLTSGGVHPAYRRRGLGAQLLAAGIAAAETLHAIHHPDLPLAVDVQNNAENTGALACYRAAGLTPFQRYNTLHHPLSSAIVDAPPPDGFAFETHSAANDPDFFTVNTEADLHHRGGAPMPLASWHGYLGWSAFCPTLSFLLRDLTNGRPAAILLTFSWPADTEATGIRDAQLTHLGTRPAYRNRGLATALLNHALHSTQAAGFDRASLEADAETLTGAGLYERAGFGVVRTEVRYTLGDEVSASPGLRSAVE